MLTIQRYMIYVGHRAHWHHYSPHAEVEFQVLVLPMCVFFRIEKKLFKRKIAVMALSYRLSGSVSCARQRLRLGNYSKSYTDLHSNAVNAEQRALICLKIRVCVSELTLSKV